MLFPRDDGWRRCGFGVWLLLVSLGGVACDDKATVPPEESADAPVDEASQSCSAAEQRCLGDDTLLWCAPDGLLQAQSCAPGELCYAGVCGPVICTPYTIESCLDSGHYEGCNPMGTGYGGGHACPAGQSCIGAGCTERLCQLGEMQCLDEAWLGVCNQAGSAFEPLLDCPGVDPRQRCDEGMCRSLCDIVSKSASYIGCSYWAVDLDNAIDGPYDAAGQPFAVVISNATAAVPARVRAYAKEGYQGQPQVPLLEIEVAPGDVGVMVLPPGCYDGPICPEAYAVNNTTIVPAAYRIESDVPVTAYQFNPLDNVDVFSNDASILFPTTGLGRRYMVMTRMQQHESLRGFLTVVASEPGSTRVEVSVTGRTLAGRDAQGREIPAMSAGETRVFTLEQFDVLNIATNRVGADLTGSVVSADRAVAVFGGSEAANAPETVPITCCADHLEQQLYPISAWGRRYLAVKAFPRRGERDMWRIMARLDGTEVETIPDLTQGRRSLQAGEWFEIMTRESFEIRANLPIFVGQFLTSEWDPIDLDRGAPGPEAAGTGDPAFILGVPIEQYRSQYAFLVPGLYAYNYVTLIAPLGARVWLDEAPIAEDAYFSFGSGEYVAARLPLQEGAHRVRADAPVGLFIYGFDRFVSYGYPAGLDLRDLFE